MPCVSERKLNVGGWAASGYMSCVAVQSISRRFYSCHLAVAIAYLSLFGRGETGALVSKMALQGRVTGVLGLGRSILNKELLLLKSRCSPKESYLKSSSVRIETVRCAASSFENQRKKPKLGLFGKAVLLGIGVGGAYGYYSYEQRKKLLSKPASGSQFLLKEPPPEHAASRRVRYQKLCYVLCNACYITQ